MAKQLGAHDAFSEDPCSDPSIHILQHKTTLPAPGRSDASSLCRYLRSNADAHPQDLNLFQKWNKYILKSFPKGYVCVYVYEQYNYLMLVCAYVYMYFMYMHLYMTSTSINIIYIIWCLYIWEQY